MNIKISKIAKLPTTHGKFLIQSFKEPLSNGGSKEHLMIYTKDLLEMQKPINTPINVRIHSECLTGDAIGSVKCDCQAQLNFALDFINKHNGIVLYLRQEGRDIGLLNKVNAYALQDGGADTVEANHQLGFKDDERTYEIVDFIFDYFEIKKINMLSNNPHKLNTLKVEVVSRIPIKVGQTKENMDYLKVKKDKMSHLL